MIAAKYVLFAVIATAVNLLSQFISFEIYSGSGAIYLAILVGTGSGLVTKYVLDSKMIFDFEAPSRAQNLKTFGLYSFTGVFTTIVFWGTELAFDALMADENAKYYGALLGLSIGYVMKYFLDKKYVFVNENTV